MSISKRTIKIAKQSIFLGIGLSIILMIFAGVTGYIKPVYGAIIQELVYVSVMLLALRARKMTGHLKNILTLPWAML